MSKNNNSSDYKVLVKFESLTECLKSKEFCKTYGLTKLNSNPTYRRFEYKRKDGEYHLAEVATIGGVKWWVMNPPEEDIEDDAFVTSVFISENTTTGKRNFCLWLSQPEKSAGNRYFG